MFKGQFYSEWAGIDLCELESLTQVICIFTFIQVNNLK